MLAAVGPEPRAAGYVVSGIPPDQRELAAWATWLQLDTEIHFNGCFAQKVATNAQVSAQLDSSRKESNGVEAFFASTFFDQSRWVEARSTRATGRGRVETRSSRVESKSSRGEHNRSKLMTGRVESSRNSQGGNISFFCNFGFVLRGPVGRVESKSNEADGFDSTILRPL